MDSQETDSTLEVVVSHPIPGIGSGVPLIVLGALGVVGGGVPGGGAFLGSLLTPRLHNATAHWKNMSELNLPSYVTRNNEPLNTCIGDFPCKCSGWQREPRKRYQKKVGHDQRSERPIWLKLDIIPPFHYTNHIATDMLDQTTKETFTHTKLGRPPLSGHQDTTEYSWTDTCNGSNDT